MEWSDEKPAETIDLYVFAGRDGSFTLYEDENTNYNYEKGRYAFNGMLKNRKFNIILVSPTHAQGLDIDHTVAGKVVKYSGSRVVVKL